MDWLTKGRRKKRTDRKGKGSEGKGSEAAGGRGSAEERGSDRESTPIDSVPVLGNKRMTAAGVGKQQQQKRKDRLGQLVRGK